MNLKNIEMVVFDMAGTTIDENNVVYKTIHKAIERHGIETNLDTILTYGAGKEKLQAIKDILAFLQENKDPNIIFEDFKIMLDNAYESLDVKPIAGIEKTISKLKDKGIKVVLNTGYNSQVANRLLNKLQWEKGVNYDLLLTASDVKNGRPAPDMIIKAMNAFDINEAKNVLKAGDSSTDITEGKNAGCGITVGVLSGAQNKMQLEKAEPDFILDSLAYLLDE